MSFIKYACFVFFLVSVATAQQSEGPTEQPVLIAPENTCQQQLLNTIPPACQSAAVNLTSANDCKFICSLCLSAVLTVSANSCGAYAEFQANFSAQCQWCFTQPPTTTSEPTTTEAATTTSAQTTNAQGSPQPTVQETPAPTYAVQQPTCSDVLLRVAGRNCNTTLAPLVRGSFSTDQCHWVCAPCLSAILAVPGCYCEEYEALQSHVVKQCLNCYAPATTEASTTTGVGEVIETTAAQTTIPPQLQTLGQ